MRKVKGFVYDVDEDKDVIKHVDKQGNNSKYILDLIRKDMNKESIDQIIERKIAKYFSGKVQLETPEKRLNTDAINDIINM